MQIESVKNNNHELYVLSKPEKDQNNRILWNFNYFEDDMWETASLDCKDLQIYSNKVGNEEYKDVMIIMKLLPFQQVKIFGRLVVADKEYARNLLEISMNHLQSRSFRLRVSLKKIMQCATII